MDFAKRRRLSRFFDRVSGRGIILPMDHGLTLGPIKGIERTGQMGSVLRNPEINGVVLHKGTLVRLMERGALDHVGVLLHVNGMSSMAAAPDTKELIADVGTAAAFGAEGISLQINFDGTNDAHNLRVLGAVADAAFKHGMPLLTMLYDKVPSEDIAVRIRRLNHLVRIAIELGTDLLKLSLPATEFELRAVLENAASDVHIFFAGGALIEEKRLFHHFETAMALGAKGVCVGRNIFERDEPGVFLRRLRRSIDVSMSGEAMRGSMS